MDIQFFSKNGFDLSQEERDQFEKYLALFLEYNSHTNLSAIRDEQGIIEKHFVDSLMGGAAIAEKGGVQSKNMRLLDIGSGGGFPGIPLKIVFPDLDVTLLDSVGKKVKAMQSFIEGLGLQNIQAIQERAEILAKDSHYSEKYDFVVSRATAYITDILTWAKPFLNPKGKIILYKMPSPEELKDSNKIAKKLGLTLEGELFYELAQKQRVIYVFSQNEDRI